MKTLDEIDFLMGTFKSPDPYAQELADAARLLAKELATTKSRLAETEAALSKVGLLRCFVTCHWFKHPEDGFISSAGVPISWGGYLSYAARTPELEPNKDRLCAELINRHWPTITAVFEGTARPCPVSQSAEALGLRFPREQSTGPFAAWFKRNPWALKK